MEIIRKYKEGIFMPKYLQHNQPLIKTFVSQTGLIDEI
jgi:hypothetical protein